MDPFTCVMVRKGLKNSGICGWPHSTSSGMRRRTIPGGRIVETLRASNKLCLGNLNSPLWPELGLLFYRKGFGHTGVRRGK